MKTNQLSTTGIISAALITLLIIVSCNVIGEIGSGNVIREERKVSSFNGIEVSGAYDIKLIQGTANSVIIEADDNLMDLIRTEVRGSTLVIDNKKPIAHSKSLKVLYHFYGIKIHRCEWCGQHRITGETYLVRNGYKWQWCM